MSALIDLVLVGMILASLSLLAASRIKTLVQGVAAQGVLLGLYPLLVHADRLDVHTAVVGAVTLALKGAVFPWLLLRTMRRVRVNREVEPYVSHTVSMLGGCAALAFSFWLSGRMSLETRIDSATMVVPVCFLTMFVGLFLVVTRRKALTQAAGFLIFDNGIYLFGLAFVGRIPVLVELGVLLDTFVALSVMGIAVYRIQSTFAHIDADRLDALRG